MRLNALKLFGLATGILLAALPGQAETINLQQAVEMSLAADPRIKEREQVVEAARGLLQEVKGNAGWRVSANAFIGLAPEVEGGFYQGGADSCTCFSVYTRAPTATSWNGVSDWTHLDFALVKPLYTFGKIERYGEAAQGNVDLKRGELKQTRGDIGLRHQARLFRLSDRARHRVFLEDMQGRLNRSIARSSAISRKKPANPNSPTCMRCKPPGACSPSMCTRRARSKKSASTAEGADRHRPEFRPGRWPTSASSRWPFPQIELAELQARALQERPEMQQLEAGLRARRALVGRQEGRPHA
jgi:outer membrane protein